MVKTPKLMSNQMSEALAEGDIDALVQLIEKGESVNALDGSTGQTLIISASENSYTNFAYFLISKGAKVEQRDYENSTPLMLAASRGNANLVQLLLDSGANPNRRNHNNWNALDKALSGRLFNAKHNEPIEEYDEVIKILIQYGARELP